MLVCPHQRTILNNPNSLLHRQMRIQILQLVHRELSDLQLTAIRSRQVKESSYQNQGNRRLLTMRATQGFNNLCKERLL